jgi:hypothetical protein
MKKGMMTMKIEKKSAGNLETNKSNDTGGRKLVENTAVVINDDMHRGRVKEVKEKATEQSEKEYYSADSWTSNSSHSSTLATGAFAAFMSIFLFHF